MSFPRRRESMSLKMKQYFVYILASGKHGTLYTGMTNNLKKRVYEHKTHRADGFTKKYNINKLVYFERFRDVNYAINREKRLKKWRRQWKINLIEKDNPDWNDLFVNMLNRERHGSPPSRG